MKKRTIIALCTLGVMGIVMTILFMSYDSFKNTDKLLGNEMKTYTEILGDDAPFVTVGDSVTR